MFIKKALPLLLLFSLIAGCGEQGSPEPAPVVEPAPPAEVDVTITNTLGDWEIVSVLIDPSDEPWTENRLGTDILAPGESMTVKVLPGTWDIMISDEDWDTYTLWEVEIGADGYTWDVTLDDMDAAWTDESTGEPVFLEVGEGDAFVEITNDLEAWTIYYVMVDPSDSAWGDDRLGSEILMPGDVITIYVDPGMYDIRCEDEDGDTYTRWGIDVGPEGYFWGVTLDDWDI